MTLCTIHLYLLSLDFKTVYPLVVSKYPSTYMYPSLLHNMAPLCMNTTKKSFGGRYLDPPPSNTTLLNPIIHINTKKKNQYQNISATEYIIIRASSLQNVMQNIKPCPAPLLNPRTNPPPPPPPPFYFILFFCFFKNLLRVKINILSSVYPEINFPAESVMKIKNLS